MSHFTVGVLTKDGGKSIDELLAPFQENNMGDCPREYMEFNIADESEEELLDEYEGMKDEYETFELFLLNQYGYTKHELSGEIGYWENPNAKWDWYEVGGRWSGMLLTKNGEYWDSAKLKDIDWEKMKELKEAKYTATWENEPEGIHRYFAGILEDDTKESYVKRMCEFSTFAIITTDGIWYEEGMMGWFGMSSSTNEDVRSWSEAYFDKFIKDEDPETILTIVDCHI